MTRKEIVKMVIEIIVEIITMSDFEVPPKLDETLQPIGDIVGNGNGFDSMNGVEFAAMVDQKISIGDIGNLCVSPDGSRALNVGEIADRILAAKS